MTGGISLVLTNSSLRQQLQLCSQVELEVKRDWHWHWLEEMGDTGREREVEGFVHWHERF